MEDRVVVYIDSQNTYMGARETFHEKDTPSSCGQINPLSLGNLLCSKSQPPGERSLKEVCVYVGRPSQRRDRRGYAAARRQSAKWEQWGIKVIPRTLWYPSDYPASRPREKGIDVSLALDYAAGAIDGDYDVGILLSTDTDLVPALEFALARRQNKDTAIEVAAWSNGDANSPLQVDAERIWCHRLTAEDYARVRDRTAYAR